MKQVDLAELRRHHFMVLSGYDPALADLHKHTQAREPLRIHSIRDSGAAELSFMDKEGNKLRVTGTIIIDIRRWAEQN